MARSQDRKWGGLYDEHGGTNILMHLGNLEAEGFIGRDKSARKYILTTQGDEFLNMVAHAGGWSTVKQAAKERPVRQMMWESRRWISTEVYGHQEVKT